MTQLVFYTNPQSRGRIIRWMLEEIGAPYRTEVMDYGPAMKSDFFLAINPMGKVPAIVHGERVVTECPAIIAYLADAFPEAGLAPVPAQRHLYYRWLFFAAGPLESAVTNNRLGIEPAVDQQRMVGYGNFDLVVNNLAMAVSASPYIAGDTFTAADLYVGSHVGWGLRFGSLPDKPEFREYFARVSDREAFVRANAIDDELVNNSSHQSH